MAEVKPRDLEKEVNDQAKEISRLLREKHTLENSLKGYKGLASQKRIVPIDTNHDHQETSKDKLEESAKNLPEPHFIGKFQQYCPTCGDKNPEFKDETVCDPKQGGCGYHLGAKLEAEKLKACPNCGGTKATNL
jgi:RNA polymerase subunit RPABC4/transcription elongation factor Spt4